VQIGLWQAPQDQEPDAVFAQHLSYPRDAGQVADQGEDLIDVVRAKPARGEGGIPSSPWVQVALPGNPSRFTPRVAQARGPWARFVGVLGAGVASLLADALDAGHDEKGLDPPFTGRRS